MSEIQLWSLWDMLRIKAIRFTAMMNVIGRLEQLAQSNTEDLGEFKTEELKDTFCKFSDTLRECVDELGLKFSLMHVDRIQEDIKKKNRYDKETERVIREMRERIQDELRDKVLLLLSSQYGAYWEAGNKAFGDEVAAKFPMLIEDISEGAKCLAAGRYTACVFHLMRVMESLVQQLGAKLGIELVDEKNWHNILEEVDKALKPQPKSPEKNLLCEASAHLHAVKLAWRNEVMHPKETYTEEQANEVFSHVKAFATDMVKVLS